MSGELVVSSATVQAALPFKAAEEQVQKPVTFRHQEGDWIRYPSLPMRRGRLLTPCGTHACPNGCHLAIFIGTQFWN